MSKTKTVRAEIDDAFLIEQTARELAAELQQEIKTSMVIKELLGNLEDAKKRIKDKIKNAS